MIFDDGKQSFTKIQSSNNNGPTSMSYFTKDKSAVSTMRLEQKPFKSKNRYLYSGIHEVPVFNLKLSNQPILVRFKFNIFRIVNKNKIYL
jgi:hypothetical protein